MTAKRVEKILCVDDEENVLHMYRRTIGRLHTVVVAQDCEDALSRLRVDGPFAVVVADYNMPKMNGIELLKRVRDISSDTVLVMLTGNIALGVAINAINETDVFRYIPKPCPTELLYKVIADGLAQYRLIVDRQNLTLELEQKNSELAAKNLELAKKSYLLEQELDMARQVYANVTAYHVNDPDGLTYHMIPKESVGGDFLLFKTSADRQHIYFMVGDVTGHGLQSALVVMLIDETFAKLTLTDQCVEAMATEINAVMCNKLPQGLFCAAMLIKISRQNREMQIWQGGLPDAYLLNKDGCVTDVLTSTNLPLGILKEHTFEGNVHQFPIQTEASLFVCSDGVTEQLNNALSMFGEEGLLPVLQAAPTGSKRVDHVLAQLRIHQQEQPQSDDVLIVNIAFPTILNALEQL